MADPIALVEMVRRSDAETLREMGALFLELADRREGNPDWDANMSLAVERVREQQAAGAPSRNRVSVPVIRRAAVKTTSPLSPDERKP